MSKMSKIKNPFDAVFDATNTKISIATPGYPADFIRINHGQFA